MSVVDLSKLVRAKLLNFLDQENGKRKWNMVAAAWESQIKCGECSYRVEESTAHPYGEGWAAETLSDCSPCAKGCSYSQTSANLSWQAGRLLGSGMCAWR